MTRHKRVRYNFVTKMPHIVKEEIDLHIDVGVIYWEDDLLKEMKNIQIVLDIKEDKAIQQHHHH